MRLIMPSLLLIFLLPSVIAATSVEVTPVVDHIIFGEKASFTITIANQREEAQTYTIVSPGTGILWDVKTQPLRDSTVYVGPKQSKDVTVTAEPIEKFTPGVYLISLEITSNTGERDEKQLKVFMGPNEPREYLPSLRVTLDMNDRIDPRESQTVHLLIENLNPLEISPLTIEVSSEIPELNIQQTLDLPPGPGKTKTAEFSFEMSDTQQPKIYYIFFQFKREDEIIKVVEKRVEVIPVTDPFTQDMQEDKKFLKKDRTLTITNTGNVRNTQAITTPVTMIQRLFTVTSPQAAIEERDEFKVYAWSVELSPGDTATISISTSYRTPAAIILLMIIGAVAYRIWRHPLMLRKVASRVEVHEGAVSGLKVTLIVKNQSNSVLKNVELQDQMPGITDVEQGVEMGSLKPYDISKKGNHTIVKWKLSELEGREERLITYKVKSRLKIVGMLQLPRAKAILTGSSGRKRVSYSNVYRVTTD